MIASVSKASMLGGLPNITALRLLKVWFLLATEKWQSCCNSYALIHENKDAYFLAILVVY
jgi:hypothetical protein